MTTLQNVGFFSSSCPNGKNPKMAVHGIAQRFPPVLLVVGHPLLSLMIGSAHNMIHDWYASRSGAI